MNRFFYIYWDMWVVDWCKIVDRTLGLDSMKWRHPIDMKEVPGNRRWRHPTDMMVVVGSNMDSTSNYMHQLVVGKHMEDVVDWMVGNKD